VLSETESTKVDEGARICPRSVVAASCWHVLEFVILRQADEICVPILADVSQILRRGG
jgi:hypothetical protein